ncbi:MAG: transcription elongation factor GreA [Hyphomicrobiaceae bacterium]|jgi:transcription elongation factor GreA
MPEPLPIVQKLSREAEALKHELHHVLPKVIETAREHGDLKENAEYHAAKERQGMVSARLGSIEYRLSELARYNLASIPRGAAGYGSIVELEDLDTEVQVRYELSFAEEVDAGAGRVSLTSPVGQAMLNKKVGDEITITLPSGKKQYEILSISTIHDRPPA